jgi:hypothetical protein
MVLAGVRSKNRIGGLMMDRTARVLSFASGCNVQRDVVARGAQEKMMGLRKEQVLVCMDPSGRPKRPKGATKVWSYNSGDEQCAFAVENCTREPS